MISFLSVALGLVPWVFFVAWEGLGPAASTLSPSSHTWTGISKCAGASMFGIGLAAYLVCSIWLMSYGQGPYVEFDPPVKLVASGPYRWVRNPVAAAVIVMILGEAIYFQSPGIFLLCVLLVPVAHYQVSRVEEPRLRLRFGNAYVRYCSDVPRWIPRIF